MPHFDSVSQCLMGTMMMAALVTDTVNARDYDIPAKNLSKALIEFADASAVDIILPPNLNGLSAPVKGDYSMEQALELLLQGTGSSYRKASNGVLIIYRGNSDTANDAGMLGRIYRWRGTLEEIVITAQKREKSLQDTPVAVSVLSARELEQRSITNLIETGVYAPNVNMATGQAGSGGNNGQFFIRGIGQSDFLFTVDPGVGIYIDGVYHPRALGSVIDVLDLERIEVLRGPQGTLYGKNTIGGAINLISVRPKEDFSGYAEVTVGYYERRDFRGSLNLPLIADKLFGRFSLSAKKRDGYGDRLDFESKQKILSGLGDEDQVDIRGGIKWLVSEDITTMLRVDYTKENENSVPRVLLSYDGDSGPTLPNLWNAFVGAARGEAMSDAYVIPGNKETSYSTGPNGNTFEGGGIGITLDWGIPTAKLRSITGYRQMDGTFGTDSDGSPLPMDAVDQTQWGRQFSQEFQFTRNDGEYFQWLAGLYYLQEYGKDLNKVRLVSGLYDGILASGEINQASAESLDLDLDILNEIDVANLALFGQVEVPMSKQIIITLGLRQTLEEKVYALAHRRVNANTYTVPPSTLSERWSAFTPMANLRYQRDEDLMLYASISRGFKSGGFNGRPLSNLEEVAAFDPEFVLSYELGIKSEWFDNRLRINAAGFVYDYTDMQFAQIAANASNNLLIKVGNVGESRVRGLEVEAQGVLFHSDLTVGAALGYLDFEITRLDPGVTIVSMGNKQVRTPKWSANTYMQYQWDWDVLASLVFYADWVYEGENFLDIQNSPIIRRDASSLFNARLTAIFFEQNWQLALFATNLTNERYLVNGVHAPDAFGWANGFYNPPRQWGISLKKSF